MSYEIFLFQMRKGVNVEEINAYLNAAESQQRDELDEEDLLPAKFVNKDLAEDDLQLIAGKAYLRVTVPESERNEELLHYLNSAAETEAPEEWQEALEMMFEYSGEGGMLPIMFSYGGNIGRALEIVARMLETLEPLGIAAYDPQIERVVAGKEAQQAFQSSAKDAAEHHQEVLRMLASGELELIPVSLDEECAEDDGIVDEFEDEDEDEDDKD